jgi:hypothetical protein
MTGAGKGCYRHLLVNANCLFPKRLDDGNATGVSIAAVSIATVAYRGR